jgi:hypothetical protein
VIDCVLFGEILHDLMLCILLIAFRFLSMARGRGVKGVDGDCLVIEADTADALEKAEQEVIERVATVCMVPDFSNASKNTKQHTRSNHKAQTVDTAELMTIKRQCEGVRMHPEKRRHIFVDNSNLFIGAQTRGANCLRVLRILSFALMIPCIFIAHRDFPDEKGGLQHSSERQKTSKFDALP